MDSKSKRFKPITAESSVMIEDKRNPYSRKNGAAELHVNQDLAAELTALNEKWRKQFDGLGKLTVADILRFPGVLVSQAEDQETFALAVQNLLSDAVKDFSAARAREGEKLQAHILERLEAMDGIVDALSELFPHLLQAHLDKARARLAEAVENIDEDRLKQEFALYMQKADVDEEFSRLKTHIERSIALRGNLSAADGERPRIDNHTLRRIDIDAPVLRDRKSVV